MAVGALPVAFPQGECRELLVPTKCNATLKHLAEAVLDEKLGATAVKWVVVLVLIRGLVTFFDERAISTVRWTTLLVSEAVGVFVRLGIVAVSSWKLYRFWGHASFLVESRVLAVAVAFDAAVMLSHVARVLCSVDHYLDARGLFITQPPTYLVCDETRLPLQCAEMSSGPRVLQGQLRFLVCDWEYLNHWLQHKWERNFSSGHLAHLLSPVLVWVCAASLVRRVHASLKGLRTSYEDEAALRLLPLVCVSGHRGDPAAAALDDHLPHCPCRINTMYARPVPLSWLAFTTPSLPTESLLCAELDVTSRRLFGLAHLTSHAMQSGLGVPQHKLQIVRQELAPCWENLSVQAPVDGLAINPSICFTTCLRLYTLQTGLRLLLGNESCWRLGVLLLFGLKMLGATASFHPGVAALVHGYWWSRVGDTALAKFDDWLKNHLATDATAKHQAGRQAAPAAESPMTEHLRSHWRHDPSYSQPLLDDWGPQDPALPPAWEELVTADEGLAAYAVFGLRSWMVVADVGIDNLGDVYLSLGLPGQRAGGGLGQQAGGRRGVRVTDFHEPQGDVAESSWKPTTTDELLYGLEHLPHRTRSVLRSMEYPVLCAPDAAGRFSDRLSDEVPISPLLTTLYPTAAVRLAVRDGLPNLTPSDHEAVCDVLKSPLDARGGGHHGLRREWHRRWGKVLLRACVRHGVVGLARKEVLSLPRVGFYPVMRVALDAMRGRWAPIAAAVLSRSGCVVPGWPPAVLPRLRKLQRTCLNVVEWSPEHVRVCSLMASFFLSQSPEEGAAYRQLLSVDIDSKTLLPASVTPLAAVTAFGSVALTGYAATRRDQDDVVDGSSLLHVDSERSSHAVLTCV